MVLDLTTRDLLLALNEVGGQSSHPDNGVFDYLILCNESVELSRNHGLDEIEAIGDDDPISVDSVRFCLLGQELERKNLEDMRRVQELFVLRRCVHDTLAASCSKLVVHDDRCIVACLTQGQCKCNSQGVTNCCVTENS